jgi:hypothetical protein
LKAKAEAATASADLAAIRHVLTRQPVIDEKLIELKRTSETKY